MLTDNMKRISVCQFSTYHWSFFQDVVRYSNHGFDSIGIWRRKVDDFDAASAADLLYDMKMSVSSIHWAGGFTGDGMTFSDAIEDAVEAIQLAGQLNAGCLILHPGARNGHTTSHATRLVASALSTLIPIAADYGVKLALEPIPNQQSSPWTFLNSFQSTLNLLERFSSDQLGLVLDMYHIGFDDKAYEFLDQFVDRVDLVQLADRKLLIDDLKTGRRCESFRLPLGQGEVPIEAWLSKLQSLGYAGQFELEVHGALVGRDNYYSTLAQTIEYCSRSNVNELMTQEEKIETRPRFQLNNDD